MISRALTLLFLVLAAFLLYQFALKQDELSALPTEAGLLHPGLEPAAITELYLKLSSGQDLQFGREPGGFWEITEPGRELARQERVAVVLDNLARAEVTPVETDGSTLDLGVIGLDPPRNMIRYGDGVGSTTLLLGDLDPFGRSLYARRAGVPGVFLVTRNLTTLLQDHAGVWVDPALFRGLRGRITRVRVDRPDGVVVDARWDGAVWTLADPQGVLADADRIARFARSLQFVEQLRVANSQVSPVTLHGHGLPTKQEVEAGDMRGATRILLEGEGNQAPVIAYLASDFLEDVAEVAAVRGDFGKVVMVDRGALSMATNAPDFFRARRVVPPVRDRARSVRLVRQDEVLLDIRRDRAGQWSFHAPDRLAGEPVEARRIEGRSPLSAWLGEIDTLEAAAFGTTAPGGEPWAVLTVTWDQAGRERTDRIEFFAETAGRIPAVSSERPGEVLLLPGGAASLVDPFQADRLRLLSPVSVSVDEWKGLVLSIPGRAEPFVLRHDGADWQGDDTLQRRRAVGFGVIASGFRGLAWEPARADASYTHRIILLGEGNEVLADLELRRPADDEESESFGMPAARARVSGYPGVELVVGAAAWIDPLDDLLERAERTEPGAAPFTLTPAGR